MFLGERIVGLVENELVDKRALQGSIFDTPLFSSNFQILVRPALI
jgi:hypothetical protein